jgi:taurine transport system substrate-binding protein
MAAGSLDVAFAIGSSGTAAGISLGIPYLLVGMVDNIGPGEDLVVRQKAMIKTPADLKGKNVATPFGSTSHFRLLGLLKTNGLTQSDVNVIDMKPDAAVAAWKRGDIDAAYVWSPAKAKKRDDGGAILSTYKKLDAEGYAIADLIIATRSFAEAYPEALTGLLAAYGKALRLWREKPEEAARIVANEAGVSPEVAAHDMKEYDFVSLKQQLSADWLGPPGKAGKFATVLKSTADFLVEQKSIRKAPGLDVFQKNIETSYLAKAAAT